MPRKLIVFDTNAYRSLGLKHIESIMAAERRMSFVAMASKHVVFELISSSCSDDPRDAGGAWSGLQALTVHTRRWASGAFIPFVQGAADQILLPSDQLRQDAKLVSRLGSLLLRLSALGQMPRVGETFRLCSAFRDYVLRREQTFGESLNAASRKAVDLYLNQPGIVDEPAARQAAHRYLRGRGPAFTAEVLAMRPDEAGAELAPEQEARVARDAALLLKHAMIGVGLAHRSVMLTVGGDVDASRSKHQNSLWDVQLCNLISPAGSVSSDPQSAAASLDLVTNEKQIIASILCMNR